MATTLPPLILNDTIADQTTDSESMIEVFAQDIQKIVTQEKADVFEGISQGMPPEQALEILYLNLSGTKDRNAFLKLALGDLYYIQKLSKTGNISKKASIGIIVGNMQFGFGFQISKLITEGTERGISSNNLFELMKGIIHDKRTKSSTGATKKESACPLYQYRNYIAYLEVLWGMVEQFSDILEGSELKKSS